MAAAPQGATAPDSSSKGVSQAPYSTKSDNLFTDAQQYTQSPAFPVPPMSDALFNKSTMGSYAAPPSPLHPGQLFPELVHSADKASQRPEVSWDTTSAQQWQQQQQQQHDSRSRLFKAPTAKAALVAAASPGLEPDLAITDSTWLLPVLDGRAREEGGSNEGAGSSANNSSSTTAPANEATVQSHFRAYMMLLRHLGT